MKLVASYLAPCLVLVAACSLLAPTDAELRGAAAPNVPATLDAAAEAAQTSSRYRALSEDGAWSAFAPSRLLSAARHFAGGTFDGRFVYLAPTQGGLLLRYDTNAAFDSIDAWSAFDTTTLGADARGFRGAAFDGRHVYLAPHGDRVGSMLVRFDTRLPFGAAESWELFDANSVDPRAEGFDGVVVDERHVYFVPRQNEYANYVGVVLRYDPQRDFRQSSAYTVFDTGTLATDANGYCGALFDGKFVYFVPFDNGTPNGVVTRLDTGGAFDRPGSWATFGLAEVVPNAGAFFGGAFDGRFLYLAPSSPEGNRVLRYDTTGGFTAAWSSFDLRPRGMSGIFRGGVYDGRFVTFVPGDGKRLVRYDTEGSFQVETAWQSFDLGPLSDGGAGGFAGGIFDGRFVYLVPSGEAPVLRFEARTTKVELQRPLLQASFY